MAACGVRRKRENQRLRVRSLWDWETTPANYSRLVRALGTSARDTAGPIVGLEWRGPAKGARRESGTRAGSDKFFERAAYFAGPTGVMLGADPAGVAGLIAGVATFPDAAGGVASTASGPGMATGPPGMGRWPQGTLR